MRAVFPSSSIFSFTISRNSTDPPIRVTSTVNSFALPVPRSTGAQNVRPPFPARKRLAQDRGRRPLPATAFREHPRVPAPWAAGRRGPEDPNLSKSWDSHERGPAWLLQTGRSGPAERKTERSLPLPSGPEFRPGPSAVSCRDTGRLSPAGSFAEYTIYGCVCNYI